MEHRHAYFQKEADRSKVGDFLAMIDRDSAAILDAAGGIRPYTHHTEPHGFGSRVRVCSELTATQPLSEASPQTSDKEKPPAAKPGVKKRKPAKRRKPVRTAQARPAK